MIRYFLSILCVGLLLVGCSSSTSPVIIDLAKTGNTEFKNDTDLQQRADLKLARKGALYYINLNASDYKDSNLFICRYSYVKMGKVSNEEVTYDRKAQTISLSPAGTFYSGATEKVLRDTVANYGIIDDLPKYGARIGKNHP